ncbi:MAG: SMP-30/gluconolactonase/LRE family protein [Thermoanaerobaculia bacterium]
MRFPWQMDRPGHAPVRSGWWRVALLVSVTAALNAVFWLVVRANSSTHQHLKITLAGSSVSASVGPYPAATWDGAPQGNGRLGITVRAREPLGKVGIEHIVVRSLPGDAVLVQDASRQGAPVWILASGWSRDAHRLLTTEPTILWSRDLVCGDCRIELDVANVRALDVFLRATDETNNLLLRWTDEGLAWHTTAKGEVSGAHGIVHYTLSESDLFARFGAELAAILEQGYRDGWRFVWWYARAALPGLLLVLLLGVVWRVRRSPAPHWLGRIGGLFSGGRAVGILVGSAVGTAAVVMARTSLFPGTLSRVTALSVVALVTFLFLLGTRELMQMRALESDRYQRWCHGATAVVVLTICAAATGYSAFAARVYLEGIPHVQDSASYLLAAKAIASGHLRIPIGPELGPFFELGVFFEHHDGYMYPIVPGLYFAGHPALLALGQILGAPWIVNPISSGITLGLLFLLCRELFGTWTGILAVLLGAISPFARFQSASMMSHTSTLLFVTAALLGLVYWLKRRRFVYSLWMGAALGALANIRPFDASIQAAYIGLVLLLVARSVGWKAILRMGLAAAAACAPFVLLILCQTATLGMTLNPAARGLLQWLPGNIDATRLRLEELNYQLFGWSVLPGLPPELTVGVLLVALLLMPKTRSDWFIAGWALLYVAGYVVTCWHANMFGPRYWYPSVGGQLVLVARLLQGLPGLVTRLSGVLWPPGKARPWSWVAVGAGVVPMVVVAGPLFVGTIESFPKHFAGLYGGGYNGFSAAPLRLLADHGVTKGLIFFDEVPEWQDLVTGIVSNDVSFSGDLIFARHIEGRDQVLMKARPEHPPYLITWNGAGLELGRLRVDPSSGETTVIPMPAKKNDPRVIDESNVYRGIMLPGGAGLVGGLAADGRGNLYVADSAGHDVLVFDKDGTLQREIRVSYSFGPTAINTPQGIAVDTDGNVYVANFNPPAVVRFNADGTFAWRAQESTRGEQRLTGPVGIAMLPGGDLVVTNMDPPELHVLRRDGTFAGYFANVQAHAGLGSLFGVAVGPNRHLYVVDGTGKALLEMDESGHTVRRWSLPLHRVGLFQAPYVAVDSRGHAYVSDFNGWSVYDARPDRVEVEVIGSSETLVDPSGVVARDGEVLVVGSGSNRVLRLPVR